MIQFMYEVEKVCASRHVLLEPKTSHHNIIHIHNNVMWDRQHPTKYSPHVDYIWKIFREILSNPQNVVVDLNNVMAVQTPLDIKFHF